MSNKLVKVLEYLVNEEREKASDLLHDVFVEKAKNHWAALSESDESVEEDIQEEDLDESYYDDDLEEDIDNYDAEDDFLDDIESSEDEIESEEIYDDEDMDDEEPVDGEEMDMEVDMGEIGGEEETVEPEEALANVEDAIAELRAAFADLMDDEESEGPDMDDDMDDMDDDMDDEDNMVAFGEGAKLNKVNVTMSGDEDGKSSPVKDAGNEMGSPHPTDTSEEKGGSAPSPKNMGVTGPQEAGKPKPAPKPKKAE